GIVTFPSFHSALAVLLVWAARGLGRMIIPVAALNAVVLAVTPIYGGHYFVDVIAGITITLCWLPALRGISESRSAHR
ncbi:MAG: phosphatase PAP2 family protein, partial [Rhodospirillaceae bacterium]